MACRCRRRSRRFKVVITPVNYADAAQTRGCRAICRGVQGAGPRRVLDDRDERPGVKFKDADLIGIPYRITIGKKLAQGLVEMVERRTKQSADVPIGEAAQYVQRADPRPTPDWEAVRAEFPALAGLDVPQYRNIRPTAHAKRCGRRPALRASRALACTDFLEWFDDADRYVHRLRG